MAEPRMTIDGEAVETQGTFGVTDPATGDVFAQAPDCTQEQLDRAMSSAQEAFRTWRQDEERRRAALRAAAGSVYADADRIAALLTAEQGKPIKAARREVSNAVDWLNYFADLEVPREIVQDDAAGYAEVSRRPLGVVAAIAPWNVPVTLAAWKIAPALRAGNTLVLKPSPFTPLSTLAMGEALNRVLPPGVLNVVSGRDPLGALMTAHSVPRKISFTGSTSTGKVIARGAADDLKRITLELGGNDPAILLDDADPAKIAERLFWGAFNNNGQLCLAVKRVYAPQNIYADVVEALAEKARTVKVDKGTVEGAELGPINNRAQFDRVAGLVEDAVAHGATVAAGGVPIDRPGYFYQPTILAGVSDGVAVVDEEQFGPALPVIAYRDVEEVVARANNSPYGLTASVWSADVDRARMVAADLDCGQVAINAHGSGTRPDLPFGGAKWSGIGVENGIWGLYSFTETHALIIPAAVRE